MKVGEVPHHVSMTATLPEFDELLLGYRIYVRDYEVTKVAEEVLAALEEVGQHREVGGRAEWTPPGWDEEDASEGGSLVAA